MQSITLSFADVDPVVSKGGVHSVHSDWTLSCLGGGGEGGAEPSVLQDRPLFSPVKVNKIL